MKVWAKGISLPSPNIEGSKLTHLKTWTSSTGRTASGLMSGRVQYLKYNLELVWGALTDEQFSVLKSICETGAQFFAVKVIDDTNTTINFTGYAGDIGYARAQTGYYFGVTVTIVER